ncbi:radical SAM protein [Candidatus Woesearchaeota archaeon]|nr:MAG: radical SAM protein [Candidatus Woesearchaeota archaeon]
MRKTWFERALFISWYCAVGDCDYCYMSTQKKLISNPKMARRREESVLGEAVISKLCGWRIEFVSGGIGCCTADEIVGLVKKIHHITGQRQWLNVGVMPKSSLEKFGDSIEGVSGSVESVNPEVRKRACPSKPLRPILKMLDDASSLGLKKSITIIIGLGETEEDIPLLFNLIEEHGIDRVTFYALNPHEGTRYERGPETEYYLKWIKATRERFPGLEIIAGSWVDRLDEIPSLLKAGADAFTKFPSIKLFNSSYARRVEKLLANEGIDFEGTFTRAPSWQSVVNVVDALPFKDELKRKILAKAEQYHRLLLKDKK